MSAPTSSNPPHQTIVLEAHDLVRLYGDRQAVASVSLSVRSGEIFAIVGESGSGKTTLARVLMGLDRPSSGRVMFDGRSLEELSRLSLARTVQPVFQDPSSSLNPRHSVASILATPLVIHGIGNKSERRSRVEAMLGKVGLLPEFAARMPSELSGGQRQRVAIARSLMCSPKILICDEPTSSLDVSVQKQVLELLRGLVDDIRLSIVFISHDLAVVSQLADRVAVMQHGSFVEVGESPDLFRRPSHPYTKLLLTSIPKLEAKWCDTTVAAETVPVAGGEKP